MSKSTRQLIVEEIYQTEISYLKSLKHCENYYHKVLLEDPKINTEEVVEVFREFDQIIAVNSMFANNLKTTGDKMEELIVEEFKKIIPFFKSYKQFCGYNENAFKIISKWEKNEYISDVLDKCRDSLPDQSNHDLKSMLIMPIQRIPRYVLLLKEFKKNTPETHSSYELLTQQLALMEDVAKAINESMKESERRLKLFRFQDVLKNYAEYNQAEAKKEGKKDYEKDIVQAHRYFVMEGVLTKVCRKTNKDRYFVLFNDILIYGEGNDKALVISKILYISGTKVIDKPDTDKVKNAFQVSNKDRSFEVFAESKDLKDRWMKSLISLIDQSKQNINDAKGSNPDDFVRPVFVPDSECLECSICKSKFTFVNRRHHCRKCGACICGECSKGKMPIESDTATVLERACKICYKEYVERNKDDKKISKAYESVYGKKEKKELSRSLSSSVKIEEKTEKIEEVVENSNPIEQPPEQPKEVQETQTNETVEKVTNESVVTNEEIPKPSASPKPNRWMPSASPVAQRNGLGKSMPNILSRNQQAPNGQVSAQQSTNRFFRKQATSGVTQSIDITEN